MGERQAGRAGISGVPAGLYVHVPFCRRRCRFCAFLITTHRDLLTEWTEAVGAEIRTRAAEFPMPFDAVYFGGGTPSLAPPESLGRVLAAARESLAVADGSEVTLEANPDDLTPGYLRAVRALGVDRLSLGLQSLDDDDLRFLTRTHSAEDGRRAFRAAREAGFGNVTVDLIYGLPHRTLPRWREILHEVLDLGPDHVSAYQLTFEPGTPLHVDLSRGRVVALPEEEERERFLRTREWLVAAGYEPYEVSSFAREPRCRSVMNRKYWEGAPWLGAGPAAHSFLPPRRWWNAGAVRNYVRAVREGRSPAEAEEVLDPEQLRLERVGLALRTDRGAALEDLAGPVPAWIAAEGLGKVRGDRLVLTAEGFAVADAVAAALLGSQA